MDPPVIVKKELTDHLRPHRLCLSNPNDKPPSSVSVINLSDDDDDDTSSRSSDASDSDHGGRAGLSKRRKLDVAVPHGFLAPLPLATEAAAAATSPSSVPVLRRPLATPTPIPTRATATGPTSKQFWKAGDYDGGPSTDWALSSGGIDHVRVHPKFLHSNATSHKWALGALAELLDNSLDETTTWDCIYQGDLFVGDNGGGMDPDKMRKCMSLGYSAKSKVANTIGQYGNGFKTSTMRLGADVIVFSRCRGKGGKSPTESIGMLSYTFLRSTGMENIVVPMLDYERRGGGWNQLKRSTSTDWNKNVETIVQWSPFSSEADLLRQFSMMEDHGTRVIIYNLWEDDQGLLELDFDADPHDIQLRGVNRDEKNIQMAKRFPNSRHYLTYKHSLRSYASILYLRLPPTFRMILCGKDIEHHNIVNDMMLSQEVTYRPQPGADGVPKDNMAAIVTIGFVKDARYHIDVQGFNVYHKNRLIKPFWRLWNPAASHGRGVIGVLEANFVEPAHDKQGFERTTVLARLEGRLIQMQKNYWHTNCHKIGYNSLKNMKPTGSSAGRDNSPDYNLRLSSKSTSRAASSGKSPLNGSHKFSLRPNQRRDTFLGAKGIAIPNALEPSSPSVEYLNEDDLQTSQSLGNLNGCIHRTFCKDTLSRKDGAGVSSSSANLCRNGAQQDYAYPDKSNVRTTGTTSKDDEMEMLKQENRELKERLEKVESDFVSELQRDLEAERERCRTLQNQLQESQKKIEQVTMEQETLIEIFTEERERRETEEQNLRKKLKEASDTIQDLLDKVRLLENMKSFNRKSDAS
ncbi:hypothetical protein CDL15_Pgr014911 [Punica granatum]|uniref:Morc S5 domain-containing protein n=1 Tax=Punica granatum TaxID=22663 RepID=A0A218Y0K3_PUNGR|nr:hypothetical protein CDL15_Pgr014911 [Punica granatum]